VATKLVENQGDGTRAGGSRFGTYGGSPGQNATFPAALSR